MEGKDEDEGVQSIWRKKWPTGQRRVPLETQHNNGERRGGWWWKIDVCGGWIPYALLSDGSNRPCSGSPSQIPVRDHLWESRKKWPQISVYDFFIHPPPVPLMYYSFIQDDTQRMLSCTKLSPEDKLTLLTTELWTPPDGWAALPGLQIQTWSIHTCLITWTWYSITQCLVSKTDENHKCSTKYNSSVQLLCLLTFL